VFNASLEQQQKKKKILERAWLTMQAFLAWSILWNLWASLCASIAICDQSPVSRDGPSTANCTTLGFVQLLTSHLCLEFKLESEMRYQGFKNWKDYPENPNPVSSALAQKTE
jgi:hypothetical protein